MRREDAARAPESDDRYHSRQDGGGTVEALIWVVGGLAVLMIIVNGFKKSSQASKGHDRCQACGSRLKFVRGNFMATCRKCGARQDWAP